MKRESWATNQIEIPLNNLAFLDESSIIQHIRGFMGVPNPIDESTRA
ncbi:MAG: hypothetical protein RR009_09115 [Oscillospiraceae bacterium]